MHNGINMVISDSIRPQEPAFWSGSPRAEPLCLLFLDIIVMIIMALGCGCAWTVACTPLLWLGLKHDMTRQNNFSLVAVLVYWIVAYRTVWASGAQSTLQVVHGVIDVLYGVGSKRGRLL
jgi:hypothetical protein